MEDRFQSTFPRGERQLRQDSLTIQIQFQSTFPRGERPVVLGAGLAITADFNPRSRVGNDGKTDQGWNFTRISIHVPAWGTTKYLYQYFASSVFQSTFPRGERQRCSRHVKHGLPISIHVPAWGTTGYFQYASENAYLFQSTFPRGERPGQPAAIPIFFRISIHVPAWGTTMVDSCWMHPRAPISIHVPAWGTTAIISKIFSYILGIITKNIT